ncbi:MAG: hypothetical protein ABSG13_03630 [Bryobacteraceae bacterium]|jgi:hypothetical protein
MRALNFLVAAMLPALCLSPLCRAGLIDTTVTGDLNFAAGTTNFYDPANGFVPATGYSNSASNQDSPTVTIVGGNEFGYQDGANQDITSFSATGFTFTDTSFTGGGTNITLTFTDSAFTGVSELTNTFSGLTYGIAGDVITVNIPGFTTTEDGVLAASFSVTSTSEVPEPSGFPLLAIGAAGLIWLHKVRTARA